MATLAELKELGKKVSEAAAVLENAMNNAGRAGLVVTLETVEIGITGAQPIYRFEPDVRIPMDLLDSLES